MFGRGRTKLLFMLTVFLLNRSKMIHATLHIPSSCSDVTVCEDSDEVQLRFRCLIKYKYDSSVVSEKCRSDLIAEEIRVLTEDSKSEMIFDPYLCAPDISDRDIPCDVSGNSASKLLKCLFENVRLSFLSLSP